MLSQRVITTSSYSCGQQQMVGGEQGLILSFASEKKNNNKKNKKINGSGTSQARGRTRIFVFHSPPVSMCFSTSFQEPFIPRTFDPLDTLPDLFHGMLDETKAVTSLFLQLFANKLRTSQQKDPNTQGQVFTLLKGILKTL